MRIEDNLSKTICIYDILGDVGDSENHKFIKMEGYKNSYRFLSKEDLDIVMNTAKQVQSGIILNREIPHERMLLSFLEKEVTEHAKRIIVDLLAGDMIDRVMLQQTIGLNAYSFKCIDEEDMVEASKIWENGIREHEIEVSPEKEQALNAAINFMESIDTTRVDAGKISIDKIEYTRLLDFVYCRIPNSMQTDNKEECVRDYLKTLEQ